MKIIKIFFALIMVITLITLAPVATSVSANETDVCSVLIIPTQECIQLGFNGAFRNTTLFAQPGFSFIRQVAANTPVVLINQFSGNYRRVSVGGQQGWIRSADVGWIVTYNNCGLPFVLEKIDE